VNFTQKTAFGVASAFCLPRKRCTQYILRMDVIALHILVQQIVPVTVSGNISILKTFTLIKVMMKNKQSFTGSAQTGCDALVDRSFSNRNVPYGFVTLTTWHHIYSQNVGTNFVDKRWSLGRYSSLADSGHGVGSTE
jgi:hypothetical protein